MLLYITGYGRSGSTLLDRLLDAHPAVLGVGELTWLFDHALLGRPCSCARPVLSCPLWGPVLERSLGATSRERLRDAAALTHACEARAGARDAEYVRLWAAVVESARASSGAEVVVDSSKSSPPTARRLELLARAGDVRAVHLVRDPRAVMWSVARGSNQRLEAGADRPVARGGAYRGLVGWVRSNMVAERSMRRAHVPWLRLHYEQLAQRPAEELACILEWLGLVPFPVEPVDPEATEFGHAIAGNRMRRRPLGEVRPDVEWQAHLGRRHRVAAVLAQPWAWRYRGSVARPLDHSPDSRKD